MSARRIFSLSAHADYTCRHSGACCTADWAIPVEADRRAVLGTEVLRPGDHGGCHFHDRDARRCRVHRDHGDAMLPSACYHFPRRALIDDRGVFVSLSHFCPTAAELLIQSPGPLTIVEMPRAFPADRQYEGLDARGTWAPLVKVDLLFDHQSYARWERYVVTTLDEPEADSAWTGLGTLAATAEYLRGWTPEVGPLEGHVSTLERRAWTATERRDAWRRYERFADLAAYEQLLALVPAGLRVPSLSAKLYEMWTSVDTEVIVPPRVTRRYLAAKAFGSWAAYDAFGVRTAIAELALAALVLQVEAARVVAGEGQLRALDTPALVEVVRAADWLLVHLVDRPALMTWLGTIEDRTSGRRLR